MPLSYRNGKWYWGSKGGFDTKAQALAVARAAFASGYHEQTERETMNKQAIAQFAGTLLHSATVAHFMHLQTRSYAEHKALGEYYEGIPNLVDALVETIQGSYGIVNGYPDSFDNPVDTSAAEYFTDLKEFVTDMRIELPQESAIQNEVDTIENFINSTLYQLTFLR